LPKCILIVDDNALLRKALRSFLESQGYEVCGEAENGLDAIEKARVLNPDLITLDLSMPRMNGLEAAPILRAMLPEVPIILFTLHKDTVIDSTASKAGISVVVGKANDTRLLAKEVQKLLTSV
jgi:DNA-binding NarL/FixJ family response regulator